MPTQPTTKPTDTTSRIPHSIALLLAAVVFPLIWVGGLVTTTDAGMAVPDWPNTYGYNMFMYPLEWWLYGPFDLMVEHGHRLLGTLAGLIAIALVFFTYRSEARPWVKRFSVFLLALIILQGLLGGARVVLDARVVAKIHGCVGQLCFAFVAGFITATSRWWQSFDLQQQQEQLQGRATKWMARLAPIMLTVSFGQLVVGAFMRHINVDSPSSLYVLLVAIHIMTAVLIVGGTLFQWFLSRRGTVRGSGVRGSINLLGLLVLTQFGLGLTTWVVKFGWPAMLGDQQFAANYIVAEKSFPQMNLVTAHVAVGSLILAFWMVHALRCRRSYHATARLTLTTNP